MSNIFTFTTEGKTRTMTAKQFVEALRDLLLVSADIATKIIKRMEAGKTYTIGDAAKVVKNLIK